MAEPVVVERRGHVQVITISRPEARNALDGAAARALAAAADELDAATREAMAWMAGNPCPDAELGGRVGLMLSTCAEVALTAERALTDPTADFEAVFGRLGDLLAIIDFHSETLEAW